MEIRVVEGQLQILGHLMQVSSKFIKSLRGRGENDAIETEAEPRFLLHHSHHDPKGFLN